MDREELADCTEADLTDTVGQLHGISCAAHRHLLTVVAELDERTAYREDGAPDMAAWLAAKLSLAPATARAWVQIARALESLPAIANAYAAGTLSWDQVRSAVRVATPETDAEIAELAQRCSAFQLADMARRRRRPNNDEANNRHACRFLSYWWEDDHTFLRLSGRLPAEGGAVVEAALNRVIDARPPDIPAVYGEFRTRAADALVELASQRLDADFDTDRATVVAHVDAAVLAGGEGVAELESGGLIAAETARRLACDARIETAVHGNDGTPLGVGRATRSVPPWLARQIKHRDKTCRFPGCSRTRFTNNHHIDFWVRDEGPTDLRNLLRLCWFHHRMVHEGGWSVRGDPAGDVEFLRPDGSVFRVGPPFLRDEVRLRLFDENIDGDTGGLSEAS
jgi:Domain of unknown function (DUF222)